MENIEEEKDHALNPFQIDSFAICNAYIFGFRIKFERMM